MAIINLTQCSPKKTFAVDYLHSATPPEYTNYLRVYNKQSLLRFAFDIFRLIFVK